jgi:hypothetical protein
MVADRQSEEPRPKGPSVNSPFREAKSATLPAGKSGDCGA